MGELQRLDPRVIRMSRISSWIFTASVSIPLFFAAPVAWLASGDAVMLLLVWGAWALLTAGLAWLAHFWPAIEYRHSSYRIDPAALEIRRGVLFRTVITVPRSRVQHLDVSQGPLERSHGLASLSVYTAGTEHAQVSVKGLAHETAIAIRDQFLPGLQDDGV
jgi:membrane protein YdbS with pleckstrin-like domain